MPRNMSFAITTSPMRKKTKTVTRRLEWLHAKKGDIINACVKCMGLKPGEKIERICQIRVTSVTREKLSKMIRNAQYGREEANREGFPGMSGAEFVAMFCKHMRVKPSRVVTRIAFEYVE